MIPILLLLQAAAAPAPAAVPVAPWTPRERTAANGTTSLSASAMARDGSSRFVVKCDRGADPVVSIQFFTKQPLQISGDDGNFAPKLVALRFNDGAAMGYNWQFQPTATYIADIAAVTELTRMMAKSKVVKIETTNASGFVFEATVDLAPTDAPIVAVLNACGYKLGEVPPPIPAKAVKEK